MITLYWYREAAPEIITPHQIPAFSANAMELRKMVTYHSSEYWYMGSMLERSVVQKNSSWVRVATGMYLLRVSSISLSVCSWSATLACGGGGRRGEGGGGREEGGGGRREGGGGRGREEGSIEITVAVHFHFSFDRENEGLESNIWHRFHNH